MWHDDDDNSGLNDQEEEEEEQQPQQQRPHVSVIDDSVFAQDELVIVNNDLSPQHASTIAVQLESEYCMLTKLHIPWNDIGHQGAVAIARALQSPHSKLTRLDFCDNQIGAHGALAIADALQSEHCKLRALDLSFNNIEPRGAVAIARALESPQCGLVELMLSGNGIDDEAVATIARALSECRLQVLGLSNNRVGDTGAEAIAAALQSPSSSALTSLSLWNNNITNQGVEAIAGALQSSSCRLRKLDLCTNRISDDGAVLVARAIASKCVLEELNLENNLIGDTGAMAIAHALTTNVSLTKLNLSLNQITYFPLDVCCEWYRRCALDISYNKHLRTTPPQTAKSHGAFRAFMNDLASDCGTLSTVTIVLLGRSGAGKTQFKRLALLEQALLPNDPAKWNGDDVKRWLKARRLTHLPLLNDDHTSTFRRLKMYAKQHMNDNDGQLLMKEIDNLREAAEDWRSKLEEENIDRDQPLHISTKGIEYDSFSFPLSTTSTTTTTTADDDAAVESHQLTATIMDCGGQQQYIVTHSVFMKKYLHGIYVLVINLHTMKEGRGVVLNDEWQQDLDVWLDFVSTSVPGWERVPVVVLLTHSDCLSHDDGEHDEAKCIAVAEDIVSKYEVDSVGVFAVGYCGRVEDERWPLERIRSTIYAWSCAYAAKIPVPGRYQRAEAVLTTAYGTMLTSNKVPLLSLVDVQQLVAHNDDGVDDDSEVCQRIIAYLNSISVLYSSRELSLVVLKPLHWLPQVLSAFISDDSETSNIPQIDGRVSLLTIRQHRHKIFCHSDKDVDKVMTLLMEFQLCYSLDNEYMFPAMLPRVTRMECLTKWTHWMNDYAFSQGYKIHVLGRRWKRRCDDKFFPPSLFPALQVELQRRLAMCVEYQGLGCLIINASNGGGSGGGGETKVLVYYSSRRACMDLIVCGSSVMSDDAKNVLNDLMNMVHCHLMNKYEFECYALCPACIADQEINARALASFCLGHGWEKLNIEQDTHCIAAHKNTSDVDFTVNQLLQGSEQFVTQRQLRLEHIQSSDLKDPNNGGPVRLDKSKLSSTDDEGYFNRVHRVIWRQPKNNITSDGGGGEKVIVLRVPHGSVDQKEAVDDLSARMEIGLHSNINSVIGVCELSGRFLVALPAERGNLHDYIHSTIGPVHVREVLKIALDVARGLEFLHRHHYVHRDVRPPNILEKEDGSGFAITDFGLSRRVMMASNDKKSQYVKWSKSAVQPPARWMPPESLRVRSRRHSQKSDVWMYALTICSVITKNQPYQHSHPYIHVGQIPEEMMEGICKGEIRVTDPLQPLPTNCTPGLVDLLNKCVAVNEDERPTAEDIVNALLVECTQMSAHIRNEQQPPRRRTTSLPRAPGPAPNAPYSLPPPLL